MAGPEARSGVALGATAATAATGAAAGAAGADAVLFTLMTTGVGAAGAATGAGGATGVTGATATTAGAVLGAGAGCCISTAMTFCDTRFLVRITMSLAVTLYVFPEFRM